MSTTASVTTRPSHPALAPVALLITGSLLGLNMNTAKHAIELGLSPAPFLFWSALFAGIVLFGVAHLMRQPPKFNRATMTYGLVSGFLTIGLANTLLFLAIPHVGAGFVSLVGAFPPLYTYLLALILRMEVPHWLRATGVALGIAGAILLGASKSGVGGQETAWAIVALAVPLIIALGNIYRTRFWPQGATAFQLAPLMLFGAALSIGIYIAILESSVVVPTLTLGLSTGVLILQIAILSLMYVMYFVLQKVAGPVYFSQIGSVGAVLGAAVAVYWFGEALPSTIIPAGLAIAAGVTCVTLGQRLVQRRA